MKKVLRSLISVVLTAISTATFLNAQVTDKIREVGTFDKINLSGPFKVELRRGSFEEVSVTIEESLHNYVQVYVEDGELKVYIEEKKMTPDARKLFRSRKEGDYKLVICTPGTISSLTLSAKINLTRLDDAIIDEDSMLFTLNDEVSMSADLLGENKNIRLIMNNKSSSELSIQSVENFYLEMNGNSSAKLQLNSRVNEVVMSGSATCVYNFNGEDLSVNSKGTTKLIFNGNVVNTKYLISGSADVNAENLTCESAEVNMSGLCSLTVAARNKLGLDMKNGAMVMYKNAPEITINSIKNATVERYGNGL